MPQHLWRQTRRGRICEVCCLAQLNLNEEWMPDVSPICAGDPD